MARTSQELKAALRGLVGFGVTPFHRDFTINLEALRQNSAHLADFCDVVVPLGNNGEIFSLSPEEQNLVGRTVVEEVRGRKPVIVGVGYALPVVLELVKAAEAYGADGILVLPPSATSANDDGLADYYRTVAANTKLGIVLFQTPAFNFSVGLLRCLREIPNIVGMKDEHGDMKQFVKQWRAASDHLELLCGVGEILAPSYFALGVKGFTSGIVNFMPRTPLRIMELLRTGQLKPATEVVEREAMPVFDLRGKRPGYTTVVIKEGITLCGLDVGPPRPPLAPLAQADREELRTLLRQLGILKGQTA